MSTYDKKDADLAARILRPEYIPTDFLSYTNDYNALNQAPIPLSNVIGVNAAMVPIGVPLPWLTGETPYGYVLLDGSVVSRIEYVLLFQLWGVTFGSGDGSTTFGLPDFRGRMLVGKGTHTDVDTLGETEGEATVGNRRPKHKHSVTGGAHTHTITDPGHTHGVPRGDTGGAPFDMVTTLHNFVDYGVTTQSNTTGITINSADATPTVGPQTSSPTDGPAYMVVNYITRYTTAATPQPVKELPQAMGE